MMMSHYCDTIMGTAASQVTSLTFVYITVYSDADQSKHQISASLAFVWGIHQGPVNSPHKWPVMREMFPFDDVIMIKWKHFPLYCPFVQGNHRSLLNSPHIGQWCGALMFSLICTWINGWANNHEAGDLRHHHAHYDVTVMTSLILRSRCSTCLIWKLFASGKQTAF